MKKLAMRYWMAVFAVGSLLTGIAMGQTPPATTAGQAAPGAPGAATQAHNNVRPAIEWKRLDYTCAGEAKVTVYLHGATARVLYLNHQYLMRLTESRSGKRYSDGKTVWWSKGERGVLQEETPDGAGKMIVKGCKLAKPLKAGEARKP
jgi:membrane-bound inhibitor of C-type lysozyme